MQLNSIKEFIKATYLLFKAEIVDTFLGEPSIKKYWKINFILYKFVSEVELAIT